MFATPTGQIARCEIDARVGGTFTIVDRRGGDDIVHAGTYVALERPRLIVFTFSVPKVLERGQHGHDRDRTNPTAIAQRKDGRPSSTSRPNSS